ncbi:MAG: branched-chain amino acid ABC transporter permease, partial [Alicyclobacillaceae bacterium]|nr:branched-chain amino acid ABC transporter permease [Alicyclobacillaceae bacterium]
GPLLGSLVVAAVTQLLSTFEEYQMLIFGPVLVLLVIFFPGGLAGLARRWKFRTRRGPGVRAGEPAEEAPTEHKELEKEML